MGTGRAAGVALAVGLLLTACSGDDATTDADGTDDGTDPSTTTVADLPEVYEGYVSDQYAEGANWLCHPDDADENVCGRDLDATVVGADGSTEVERFTPAEDPAIDCFYVYPTISTDPGANSDLEPAEGEEIRTVLNQVARLGDVCEIHAPVYRQRTLTALLGAVETGADTADLAYDDVVDAWRHYLANDNEGRGVLLVGHSQGAGLLSRLLAEEIDDEPAVRDRLVAAYLLGGAVGVPPGEDVGGDFDEIPLCRADDQTGCVVTYASFPSSPPPPDDSFFGVTGDDATVAGCTNPAALEGGTGVLVPYFSTDDAEAVLGSGADTPWVSQRDVLTAECVEGDGRHYLEVTLGGDPENPDVGRLGGGLPPNWGLHLADVNLAMGNLVELARSQAAAYAG